MGVETVSYTVLVFVKQVPDTQNISGDAMTPEGTVNRAALPAIFNVPTEFPALADTEKISAEKEAACKNLQILKTGFG